MQEFERHALNGPVVLGAVWDPVYMDVLRKELEAKKISLIVVTSSATDYYTCHKTQNNTLTRKVDVNC